MKSYIYISFILILVLSSCKETNNQYYVNQIDSLEFKLVNALDSYSTIDSIPIVEIRKNIKATCNRLTNLKDTIISSTFIPYSQLDKSMKQILRMDTRIKKELKTSSEQISNLLYDAKNNLIDTVLLSQYIEEEKRILLLVTDRMKYNTDRIKTELIRYDSLNQVINQYLIKDN